MAIKIRANTNTKVIKLPMGITDPKTGEVSKEVTIAGMDGHSEEKISEKKLRNNGAKIITALLGEKIVGIGSKSYPKGIGVGIARKMWTADRDTCLVEIRGMMADDMSVSPKCPECGYTDEDVIYMSRMEKKSWDPNDLPDGLTADDTGVIMFELPDGIIISDDEKEGDEEVLCKMGRIRLADGEIEENVAAAGRDNPGVANTTLLAASIVELEHVRIVDSHVVNAMSKRDRDYLADILNKCQPGPSFVREHECPECGAKFKYILRLPDFFTSGKNQ